MNGFVYLKDVVSLELNREKCSGCMMCIIVCPHEVFEMKNKKVMIAKKDLCMECGACQKNCPDNAISVRSGVGCAAGIINGILRGSDPSCDCSNTSKNVCC
jgi:NAD-dependent dihydropyrimidine dehydrogenase PreA subunit